MTKQDIIDVVSARVGIEKTQVKAAVDETINAIAEKISEGETIYLRRLFTLMPVKRAKKKAQYISKKKTIILPERLVPKAKFSKSIIDKMKKLPVDKK